MKNMNAQARLLWLGIALSIATSAAQESLAAPSGNVAGTVTIDGRTDMKGYKLDEAILFLEGAGLTARSEAPLTPQVIVLDQKNKTYVPHVLPVVAGTPVEIRNSDPEMHNVHVSAKKNPGFNLGMPKGMKPQRKVFSKPELVTFTCNVHRDMRAYVLVLENPRFTMPMRSGTFEIQNVPPGAYAITLWHEKFEEMKKEVTVKAGESSKVDFELKNAKAIRRK